MELVQSFLYTIGRVRLSMYEQRILLKVVEHAQSRVRGLMIKDNLEQLDHDFNNVHFVLPIKDILTDTSNAYDRVEAAAKQLETRIFEYRHDNGWFSTPMIYNVNHDHLSGTLDFYVARKLFDIILDFSKGFREYNLETALSLPTPYASRLYALCSGLKPNQPLRQEISELKKMFGVEDKYKQTADFIKKVIIPSQTALDRAGVNSFTFSRMRKSGKVVALLFFPVKREQPTTAQLTAQLSVGVLVPGEISNWLMREHGFTWREMQSNKQTLHEFCRIPGVFDRLIAICDRASTAKNRKGYIIGAMKKEVAELVKPQPQTADNQ